MIEVDINVSEYVDELFLLDGERLKKYAVRILESSGVADCSVSIIFIGDAKMSVLNEKYKKRKGSTDVLSFDLSDEGSDSIEGEVYVSLERAEVQSADYGVSYSEEAVRLVTHGLLHLAGRVHKSDEEYEAMTRETENFVSGFFADRELM